MSHITELLQGTFADLGVLSRQYLQLANVKAKDGARHLAIGAACAMTAALLAIVALGELLYVLAYLLVARDAGAVGFRAGLVAAILTVLVAGLLGWIGLRSFKKIAPRGKSMKDAHEKETMPWQSNARS